MLHLLSGRLVARPVQNLFAMLWKLSRIAATAGIVSLLLKEWTYLTIVASTLSRLKDAA